MFKKILLVILAGLLFNLAAASPAHARAAQETAREKVAKIGPGPDARVEVRLKDGAKLKGHVAEADDQGFTVVDAAGKQTRVAYSDVENVKAVKPKSGGKKFDEKGLIGLSLIGGIFLVTLFFVSQTK